MPGKQRYTKDEVRAALIENRGFCTMAAEALGCEPSTITNYLNRYPELREALKQEREKTLDFAELQLLHAIKDREPWAVALYLKTIGKDRGFVERQENTGKDGGPIREEITGKDGGPIELMPIRDRISARLEEMLRRQDAQHAITSGASVASPNGHTTDDSE